MLYAVIFILVDLSEQFLEFLRQTIYFPFSALEALPAKEPKDDITQKRPQEKS
ncbi:MAG: hypothetical protein V3U27_20805 [Candidatus Tectomicrobia bacterium]